MRLLQAAMRMVFHASLQALRVFFLHYALDSWWHWITTQTVRDWRQFLQHLIN